MKHKQLILEYVSELKRGTKSSSYECRKHNPPVYSCQHESCYSFGADYSNYCKEFQDIFYQESEDKEWALVKFDGFEYPETKYGHCIGERSAIFLLADVKEIINQSSSFTDSSNNDKIMAKMREIKTYNSARLIEVYSGEAVIGNLFFFTFLGGNLLMDNIYYYASKNVADDNKERNWQKAPLLLTNSRKELLLNTIDSAFFSVGVSMLKDCCKIILSYIVVF